MNAELPGDPGTRQPAVGPEAVVFSPLPPERNGIADYTAELLQTLRRWIRLVVVVDDDATPHAVEGVEIVRLSRYQEREAELAALPHLYQLGNNAGHVYMLPVLLRRPGVVVLHDTSLHHLLDQATLRYGDEAGYAAWLAAEHGAAGQLLAEQFTQRRWRGEWFFRELPMTRRLLSAADQVVVHSRFAALKARAQAPLADIHVVPHHVAPAALQAARARHRQEIRQRLGIQADEVLVVSLGFVTRAKQIDRVLDWLANRAPDAPRVRYAIVGEARSDEFDVETVARRLGVAPLVLITGFVDDEGFYDWVVASDIVVNLRYPSGGETSGVFVRAMGMGACLVVNDIGPFAEYPTGCCTQVPPLGAGAAEAFAARMEELIADRARRDRIGRAASAYMARTHGIEHSAAAYLQRLRQPARQAADPCGASTASLPRAERVRRLAAQDLPADRTLPIWLHDGLLPAASHAQASLLVIGRPDLPGSSGAWRVFGFDHANGLELRSLAAVATCGRRRFEAALVGLEPRLRLPPVPQWQRLHECLAVGAALVVDGVEQAQLAPLMAALAASGFEALECRSVAQEPTPPGTTPAMGLAVVTARATFLQTPRPLPDRPRQRPCLPVRRARHDRGLRR